MYFVLWSTTEHNRAAATTENLSRSYDTKKRNNTHVIICASSRKTIAPSSSCARMFGIFYFPPNNRSLPHQYYVRAMEASLHSIAKAEPGATVDVAIFSESQWGGMVDEMGVPLDWDVPGDICEELGLQCTQVRNRVLYCLPRILVHRV